MAWKCPDCGNDKNEDMRCKCGYEPTEAKPIFELLQTSAETDSCPPQKPIKVTILSLKLYAVISILVFLVGFYLLQIQEMGLYLFMLFINLPASVITIGVSEELAQKLGFGLGSQPHILFLQVFSIIVNAALLVSISGSIEWFVKRKKRHV